MEIYSEYFGTNRKATVTLLRQHWDNAFHVWEVTMYQNDKVIQRKTLTSQQLAEDLADDFVNGGMGDSILLNESNK